MMFKVVLYLYCMILSGYLISYIGDYEIIKVISLGGFYCAAICGGFYMLGRFSGVPKYKMETMYNVIAIMLSVVAGTFGCLVKPYTSVMICITIIFCLIVLINVCYTFLKKKKLQYKKGY